jgi:isopenicillin-N epimerase
VNKDDQSFHTDYDWEHVRAQFRLDPDYVHIGTSQYISSHPRRVREAIERYRDEMDKNPVVFLMDNELDLERNMRDKAAKYLNMKSEKLIALTDSATMGLGTIYTGINIRKGNEIVLSEHNHYSHQESAKRACERNGTGLREVPLYENLDTITEEEMIDKLMSQVTDKTAILGITWVHSDTGLKTPVAKIAKAVEKVNEAREHGNQVVLIVDGVHGFGVETETFDELGCNFLIASCHKWLYGPRGTGLIAGTDEAWQTVFPVIPDYMATMDYIVKGELRPEHMDGRQMTPGGFHTLEHRWALGDAFDFVESIGKERIRNRVYELNRLCREGLASLPHVNLITPISEELSSGITSFEIRGMTPKEAVKRLVDKKIVATEAPYRKSYVRFTPGIFNSPEDIHKALDAVTSLK